jgi:hypothetical protein
MFCSRSCIGGQVRAHYAHYAHVSLTRNTYINLEETFYNNPKHSRFQINKIQQVPQVTGVTVSWLCDWPHTVSQWQWRLRAELGTTMGSTTSVQLATWAAVSAAHQPVTVPGPRLRAARWGRSSRSRCWRPWPKTWQKATPRTTWTWRQR